ncbi:hypothetical protein ACU4GD_35375 [Cupriavidus basilensis]
MVISFHSLEDRIVKRLHAGARPSAAERRPRHAPRAPARRPAAAAHAEAARPGSSRAPKRSPPTRARFGGDARGFEKLPAVSASTEQAGRA